MFRSLKQYFLLAQGDFISQLLCLCETELAKPLDDVLPRRLEYLLELALRTSNGSGYQESIHTTLLPYTLMDQMMRILRCVRVGAFFCYQTCVVICLSIRMM